MNTRLAIASKRDSRNYSPQPLPEGAEERILEAGRVSGSASNRQQWEFVVVEGRESRAQVAGTLYAPRLAVEAALVVALVMDHTGTKYAAFDAGRAAQNMMLWAWDEGIVSCPLGVLHQEALDHVLGLTGQRHAAIVLAFAVPGYRPAPARRTPEEWIGRSGRVPLEQVVRRI